jgi:hypothetical protein
VKCSDIINNDECIEGIDEILLVDECNVYNGICKLKCSKFISKETCREDDCFWLLKNMVLDMQSGTCKEKVCYVFIKTK